MKVNIEGKVISTFNVEVELTEEEFEILNGAYIWIDRSDTEAFDILLEKVKPDDEDPEEYEIYVLEKVEE